MTDAELLEWLRKPYGDAMMERAADRIEALIAERNDWESHAIYNAEFVDLAVSYRNERDAARAELAKVVRALEQERDEAIRRRDAWKAKAEGYDAVRKALREKVGAPWPPNLSRALWAGIAADEKKRADDAETKLAKAVEEAEKYQRAFAAQSRKLQAVLHIEGVRATLAEIKGKSHD